MELVGWSRSYRNHSVRTDSSTDVYWKPVKSNFIEIRRDETYIWCQDVPIMRSLCVLCMKRVTWPLISPQQARVSSATFESKVRLPSLAISILNWLCWYSKINLNPRNVALLIRNTIQQVRKGVLQWTAHISHTRSFCYFACLTGLDVHLHCSYITVNLATLGITIPKNVWSKCCRDELDLRFTPFYPRFLP
jgi:hypothetical protein